MSLLFNGLPETGEDLPKADPRLAACFSPLIQASQGNYHVPTFIIIGDQDEIVPISNARQMAVQLQSMGLRSGMLEVKDARHIFDLGIRAGTKDWDKSVRPGFEFLLEHL